MRLYGAPYNYTITRLRCETTYSTAMFAMLHASGAHIHSGM